MDMEITVPSNFVAVSNGTLAGQRNNPDGTITFHWAEKYPIYPDTIAITVTNFQTFDLVYKDGSGEFPLHFFVFPEDLDKAKKQFPVLLSMLQSHIKHFGPYPFAREKYGIAEFTVDSFREHQTLPSLGAKLITGDNSRDFVLAHESAHQWFGNSISVKNWSNIWLNEGFASYAYALWQEDIGGAAAYQKAMKGFVREFPGPVFIRNASDENQLFSNTTFRKGAWVLHMLRHVIGDDAFFRSLRMYVSKFSYSNADTEDFRAVCEQVSGKKLDWFFSEWVYGEGQPKYQIDWRAEDSGGGPNLVIHIQQLQEGQTFRMPLDLSVQTSGGVFHFQVDNQKKDEEFRLTVNGKVTDVQIDPDGWVLHN
jgi:aminopeptidase N